MVKSISKSVEEENEIRFSYIGATNSGYGNQIDNQTFSRPVVLFELLNHSCDQQIIILNDS